MKNNIVKVFAILVASSTLWSSCDYREIGEVDYGNQKIYIPAASVAASSGGFLGLFNVSQLAVPDRSFRYVVDLPNRKLNIPLSVLRSGAILSGNVDVNIAIKTDTINTLINSGVLKNTNTDLLPANKFTVEPMVTIADSKNTAAFTLSVNLDYLLSNITRKQAIALNVSSEKIAATVPFNTAVIYIDPAFLIPSASFASIVTGATKTVSFNNTSTNGVSYSWNFGDNTAAVTDKSTTHVYTASGTYTVTLTVFGALGAENKSVITSTVVIP